MRKPVAESEKDEQNRSVKWAKYDRGGKKISKTKGPSSTTVTPTGSG